MLPCFCLDEASRGTLLVLLLLGLPAVASAQSVSPVDFDLGVKIYPFEAWVYAGVNYGTIDAQVVEEPLIAAGPQNLTTVVSEMRLEKTQDFTFSIGARTPPWRRFYASDFVGVTDNADVNNLNVSSDDPDPDFFPRFGLLLGYELPFGREGS